MPHRAASRVVSVFLAFGVLDAGVSLFVLPTGATGAEQPRKPVAEDGAASDQAFVAAIRDLMADMHRNLPAGDVDQDFVRLILSQHQAAIAMAKVELKSGKDERLKALAKDIVTSQEKEVALIKAWEDKKRGGH